MNLTNQPQSVILPDTTRQCAFTGLPLATYQQLQPGEVQIAIVGG